MNAIELLKAQHDEVEELFGQIENAKDNATKRTKFAALADRLAAHATIEETLFYPAVMAKPTRELLLESTEEHLAIKRVLADLVEMEVDDPQFDAKLSVVKEIVEHHAREEEEGELFPKVKKLLDAEELLALGGEMATEYFALLEDEPRYAVREETDAAAHLA